jgi:hypothetical protein
MADHQNHIHALDEARSAKSSIPVVRSTLYLDKRTQLDKNETARLDELEAAAKVRIACMEKSGDFASSNCESYYDCFPLVFAEGQIKAYFNQTLLKYTFLDFALFEPSDGGIIAFQARREGKNCYQIRPDIAAAAEQTGFLDKGLIAPKEKTKSRNDWSVFGHFDGFASGRIEPCLERVSTYSKVFLDQSLYHQFPNSANIGSMFDTPSVLSMIKVALGINSVTLIDLPEWSHLGKTCKSSKELENSFARRLLLTEALGEMSSKLCIERYSALEISPSKTSSIEGLSSCMEYRIELLNELVGIARFLTSSSSGNQRQIKSSTEARFFEISQDDTLLHLVLSSLLLKLTQTVHSDCLPNSLSSRAVENENSFAAMTEADRRRRSVELSNFISRFSSFTGIGERWFGISELKGSMPVEWTRSSGVIDSESLASLSVFGSITINACTLVWSSPTEHSNSLPDKNSSVEALKKCGLRLLALNSRHHLK